MRLIASLLLLTLLYSSTAEAGLWSNITDKVFGGKLDKMELVKKQQNSTGLKACDIPKFMKKRLGVNITKTKWSEDKTKGTVILDVVAKQSRQVGTATIAYKYSPRWVWHINGQEGKIRPVNAQAKNWMQGRI